MKKNGYSLLELTLVLGILSILIGFTLFSLSTSQTKNDFSSSIDTVLSDIKDQQLKAMMSDTEGRASDFNYGVHFDSNKYTLFHCAYSSCTYNSNDSTNFPINLESSIQLTNNFPNGNLVFSQTTGEVLNFIQGQNTFTIRNTAGGDQKTVTVNKYGVIIQVN